MMTRIVCLVTFLVATFGAPTAITQTPARTGLTVEWIFSDEGRRVASLPTYVWLSDGKLLLYDGRQPPSQRTFEILDPATGVRRPALDMAAAVASLNALLPKSEARQALTWPQAFDPAGRRALLLARFDVQCPELITIPASDGFPMPASILKPKDFRPDRKHPVILYVYGGASSPTVINAWQGDMLFYQLLLAEGYVIVKVDNRAATGISKRLENTVRGKIGEPETADLLDATRWLKAQPWVDAERVGVWGWSHGGFMTLNLMTRSKEFKAGISVAPVTDWRYYDTKWAEAFLQTPSENPEGYAQASLVKRAGDLHGRLLLVHGTYDDNVHPQNTQAFMDALIKAGKLFDLMIYPMRKHDIGDREATLHLYRTMLEFWKRNL